MVTISQKAFNEDMDRYLDNMRKTRSTTTILQRIRTGQKEEEVPELSEREVHIEYKEPSIFRKILTWRRKKRLQEVEEDFTEEERLELEEIESEIEALEDEESQLESMEEDVEFRKESLFSRMMQKINIFQARHKSDEDFDEGDIPEDEVMKDMGFGEDVKDILKITHSWIEKLPPKQKKAFKESSDFEKYKNILIKYGLVKVKTAESALTKPERKKITNEPKAKI